MAIITNNAGKRIDTLAPIIIDHARITGPRLCDVCGEYATWDLGTWPVCDTCLTGLLRNRIIQGETDNPVRTAIVELDLTHVRFSAIHNGNHVNCKDDGCYQWMIHDYHHNGTWRAIVARGLQFDRCQQTLAILGMVAA